MSILACTATDTWMVTKATKGEKVGGRPRVGLSTTPRTTTQMISTTSCRVDRNVCATSVNVYCSMARVNVDCSVARVNVDDQVTVVY